MITIPWLLIKESGGETTFGYISIVATLIMFLLTPFIGQSIDRFSRKSLLLCNEGIGIAIIGMMAIWGFAGQSYNSIHYIIIYIAGSFYYLLSIIYYSIPQYLHLTKKYFNQSIIKV